MSYPLEPPFVSSRVIVFSDFNCPYCFTLNEWINDLGVSDRVRWVGVEHRPDLPANGENQAQDIELLQREVRDIEQRAPEVGVVTPSSWLNSRSALLVQNAIEDDAPESAAALRSMIFRSYWREGGSLASDTELSHLLAHLGLETPHLEPDYLEELTDWWRKELGRIPTMIAPTKVVHRGLQDKETVQRFLGSASWETQDGPGCKA
jgi:predicted DsbA family dithiol-disulfide isomerase